MSLASGSQDSFWLLSIDQEKAFDRVSHKFLYEVLHRWGVPVQFIRWLRTLYQGVSANPLVNRFLGPSFQIASGVRQGCPFSPLLYVFMLEPFLHSLRECLPRFQIDSQLCQPVTAYADDTTVFLSSESGVAILKNTLSLFSAISGSRINYHKSKALWCEKGDPFPLEGFQVIRDSLKILGVEFSEGDTSVENWKRALDKAQQRLFTFKGSTNQLCTRVQILKTYILPCFLALGHIFPIPTQLIAIIYSLFFHFLWGSKIPRAKRGLTYHKVWQGGLNMVNPEVFLSSFFLYFNLQACFHPDPPEWALLLRERLGILQGTWLRGEPLKHLNLKSSGYPAYIIGLIKQLRKWGITYTNVSTLSRLGLYQHIVSQHFLEPVGLPNCPLEATTLTVANMSPPGLPNIVRTVTWYGAYNKLLVKKNVKHCRLQDLSGPRSTCVGVEETQSHLFVDCPFAVHLWCLFSVRIGLVLPLTYETLVHGLFPSPLPKLQMQAVAILLAISRYHLWNARCSVSLGDVDKSAYGLVKSILLMGKGVALSERKTLHATLWAQKWGWLKF
nr:PREDICTED: uncharacterized protein LOC106706705 [Latimeria chalumnae]|eukprot:XP_014353502.1 PREDICTED: uncharacterized protein LOC106706705 [Latimeria chalumnae]